MKQIDNITYNGYKIKQITLGQAQLYPGINVLFYDKDANRLICSLDPIIEHNEDDVKYKDDSDFWDKVHMILNSVYINI